MWYLVEQAWTVVRAPSNARITEDISGWERVCDKIIESKGCIAPDENFRTGRRARKMHEEGGVRPASPPDAPALIGTYEDLLGS
jgi:hypothetical protein